MTDEKTGDSYVAKFFSERDYQNNPNASLGIDVTKDEGNVLILKCVDGLDNQTQQFVPTFRGLQSFNAYKNALNKNQTQNMLKLNA